MCRELERESVRDFMFNYRLGLFIFSYGFDFYFKFCINLLVNIFLIVLVKFIECKFVVNNSRELGRKVWLVLVKEFSFR